MFALALGGERAARPRRAGRAMVAIGDIEAIDRRERIDDRLVLRGGHPPHLMADAIGGGEVKQRLPLHRARRRSASTAFEAR